jgi:Xaa-Pro aminopeptidase
LPFLFRIARAEGSYTFSPGSSKKLKRKGMREKRFSRILDTVNRLGLDACLLAGKENIYYLTGFTGSEGSLLVTRGDTVLMTDFRYITYAKEVTRGITVIETRPRDGTLSLLCGRYGIKKLGFDAYHLTYQAYQDLKETIPDIELVGVGNEIEGMRKCKEPEEIAIMREAIRIATEAFNYVYPKLEPGRTEKEIANDLDYAMRRLGADEPAFETIVASGPRAALPHAHPGERALQKDEVVIIDFGCRFEGYCSDETCTVIVGQVNGRMKEIYQLVDEARKKGIERVQAGIPVRDLDLVVRGFIEDAGYGEFFKHGTGHGVGIAVHETPAISPRTEGVLEENMVITVEPGIYLPNVGGVRLEDMVLVGRTGGEIMTHLRKDMLHIKER